MPMIEISDKGFEYLKSNSEPLVDTTATTFDRLVNELQMLKKIGNSSAVGTDKYEKKLKFGPDNLPKVKHTKIVSASVSGKRPSKKTWNMLLEAVLAECGKSGKSAAAILSHTDLNTINTTDESYSFYPVQALGISFQGVNADRACIAIFELAGAFSITVDAEIEWLRKEGAAYPGARADLNFTAS